MATRQAGADEVTPKLEGVTSEMAAAGAAVLVKELADDLPEHSPALDLVAAKVFAAMAAVRKGS